MRVTRCVLLGSRLCVCTRVCVCVHWWRVWPFLCVTPVNPHVCV